MTEPLVTAERVEPTPTSGYPTPARRPANSLLDCSRIAAAFGIALPDWQADVEAYVRRLAESG